MKTCKKCGADRPLGRFGINRHGNPDGTCKDCLNTKKRERYASDADFRKRTLDIQRVWKYGLSREQFDEMLASQGGGCAICGVGDPGGKGEWHIDHDHACCPLPASGSGRTCGQCVRGLLCSGCNVGLGAFGDDVDRMAVAIDYLTRRIT